MTLHAFILVCAFLVSHPVHATEPVPGQPGLAHVRNSFRFVVAAPLSRVAPLFGPEGERKWAGQQWNPRFLYPQPANDIEGAVFTVPHGLHTSVWVNTLFDLQGGRMQYVAFIPEMLVTVVDVRLTAPAASRTDVQVSYTRTALEPSANDDVRALATHDRDSGPQWQQQVENYLGLKAK